MWLAVDVTAMVGKTGQLAKPSRKWKRLAFIDDNTSNIESPTVHLDGQQAVASFDTGREQSQKRTVETEEPSDSRSAQFWRLKRHQSVVLRSRAHLIDN